MTPEMMSLKSARDAIDSRLRIYDNGGRTLDNYIVVFMDIHDFDSRGRRVYHCVQMDGSPNRPWGKLGTFTTTLLGRRHGRRIPFHYLPEQCRQYVLHELREIDSGD